MSTFNMLNEVKQLYKTSNIYVTINNVLKDINVLKSFL